MAKMATRFPFNKGRYISIYSTPVLNLATFALLAEGFCFAFVACPHAVNAKTASITVNKVVVFFIFIGIV